MGRVLSGLESLDGHLQARAAHPLLGTPSVHASTINGGGERSVYPARCSMSLERRTVVGEPEGIALTEVEAILERLRREDQEFEAAATLTLERPAYELDAGHPLPQALQSVAVAHGWSPVVTGMSFWTDAAVLDRAGIPSVLFGPRGWRAARTRRVRRAQYRRRLPRCADRAGSCLLCRALTGVSRHRTRAGLPGVRRAGPRTTKATFAGRSASRLMK